MARVGAQHQLVIESCPSNLLDLPPTLLSLLSNTLILTHTLPYIPLSGLLALSRTSHAFYRFIFTDSNPLMFRLLDLSRSRHAYLPPSLSQPIDGGGHSWRSRRMDENLTEDEFYSGPLTGILSKLSRKGILGNVNVLVLDGLASVTADLVNEIVTVDEYQVRILSVVGCSNLSQRKLQQQLIYLCRESRPEGTPRLKGLYVFGAGMRTAKEQDRGAGAGMLGGVTMTAGAMLGSTPKSAAAGDLLSESQDGDPWYAPTGRVITEGYAQRTSWEETLQVCRGIIAFDAVLCTHMHVAMAPYLHEASKDYLNQHKPGIPPLASVALGPEGCSGCRKAPESSPVWGESDYMNFPMLSPPPFSGRVVDAVRPPKLLVETTEFGRYPRVLGLRSGMRFVCSDSHSHLHSMQRSILYPAQHWLRREDLRLVFFSWWTKDQRDVLSLTESNDQTRAVILKGSRAAPYI